MAGGLDQPTAVAWTPDGRMLVAEKPGRVRVVAPGGAVDPTPLLDISNEVNDYGDRGLLGIAVAPDFATSRAIYLLYAQDVTHQANPPSAPDTSAAEVSRLTRVVLGTDGKPGPEQTILGGIPAEAPNHTIGTVRADADGTLWVGSGDAAGYSGVDRLALQAGDENSLRGKILHVDRNGRGLSGHPFCPTDSNLDHACTKVYAKGFRNPFRFALRPGAGPAVGDVGWNTREEIDLLTPGHDYGWPCYEGSIRTPGYSDLSECAAKYANEGTSAAAVPPVYDYDHSVGSSVIGGFIYRGSAYPAGRRGELVFGDYARAFVRWLDIDALGGPTVSNLADGLVGVDFEPAPDNGDIVYAGYSPLGEGFVGRIVYSSNNRPPTAVAGADATSGHAPLTVHFNAGQSSDPDGDALSYRWSFGDGSPDSADVAPTHLYKARGVYRATLRVEDPGALMDTDTVEVLVDTYRPVATIAAPANGDTFADGQQVQLRGSANDPDSGPVPDSRLEWRVVLHHADHVHPLLDRTGAQTSFVTSVDHDADSYYEIQLSGTDTDGLTGSATVIVRPRTTPFGIDSVPPGAPVSYAGRAEVTPWQTLSAIGFRTTVSAAASFGAGDRAYEFDHWSDGGAQVHDVVIPESATGLTAYYRDVTPPAIGGVPGAGKPLAGTLLGAPLISFSFRGGLDARRGLLTGRVSDLARVQELDVALRAWRDRRPGCRWWSALRARLLGRGACARPRWIRAQVRGTRWTARLGGSLPPGAYVVVLRARDAGGRTARASAATRSTT